MPLAHLRDRSLASPPRQPQQREAPDNKTRQSRTDEWTGGLGHIEEGNVAKAAPVALV